MVKRWLLVLWLALPLSAWALTFGDIQVRSKLNQPFEAVVPILSASAADLRELTVSLASDADYRRYGQEKAFFLNSLSFSVGKNAIIVRSREVFREPIVYLVLDMDWRSGRLVKSYPVLLDPPVASLPPVAPPVLETATIRTTESRAGSVAPVARSVTPTVATTARAPAKPVRVASTRTTAPAKRPSRYTVRSGDTLFGLAQRFPIRGSSFYQVAMTIYQQNPNAFVNGNPDRIIAKARIKVPTAVVFASSADAQAAYNQAKATGSVSPTSIATRTTAPAASTSETVASETATRETPVTLALRDPPAANNSELERQLTAVKAELAALQAQATDAQAQAAEARSELTMLETERAQLQKEKIDLILQVQDLEANLATTRNQVANLEQAANAGDNQLRSSLAAAEQEITTLKAQLRAAQMQAAAVPTQELPQESAQAPVDTTSATGELPQQNAPSETTTAQSESATAAEPNRETVNPLFTPTPATQNLGGNAMMVILAGGIVLAMLLLLILIRFITPAKRKARVAVPGGGEMEVDFAEPPKRASADASRRKKPAVEKTADNDQSLAGAAVGVAAGGAALAASKTDEEAVDFDNLNMDVADLASLSEDNVSPISEADTLMQFGMYAQASDLLQEELQHSPSSVDLRLKLAEVYHAEGEVAAFTEQANLLQEMSLNTDQITALTTMADSLGVSLDAADDLGDLGSAPAQDTLPDEERDFGVRPGDFDKDADMLSNELGLGDDSENREASDMFDDFDLNDNLNDDLASNAQTAAQDDAMTDFDADFDSNVDLDDKSTAGSDSDAFNLDDFDMDGDANAAAASKASSDDLDMDLFKDSDSDLDFDKISADAASDNSADLAKDDDFANFGLDDVDKADDLDADFAAFDKADNAVDAGNNDDLGDDFANFNADNDFADLDKADDATDMRKSDDLDDDFANFGIDDDFGDAGKNDNLDDGLGDDFANFDLDSSDGFNPEATSSNPAVGADDDLFADFSADTTDNFDLDSDSGKDNFAASDDLNLDDTFGGAGLDNNFDDFNQAFQSGAAMDPEEVNTQLDLASMFIDMGDKEGAQEILQNVLGSADGEQKVRAEDLLRKIS